MFKSAGFLAVLSDNKDVAASGVVAFDDVKYSNGTYNKNTGEYTIRAAGVYLIQTQVQVQLSSGDSPAHWIKIDGNSMAFAEDLDLSASTSVMLRLSVGQKVKVVMMEAAILVGNPDSMKSWFSASLLYPD